MNPPCLEIEYLQPRTLVCFSECSPLWLGETQRQFNRLEDRCPNPNHDSGASPSDTIVWTDCDIDSILDQTWIHQRPLVVMALNQTLLEQRLGIIHQISNLNGKVAVIGDPELKNYRLPLTAAGTIALVTDIFDCQMLALIIQRMAQSQRAELTGWKTRFVNRLPWPPV